VRILLELEPLQSMLLEHLFAQICKYTKSNKLEKLILGKNMNPTIYCINQLRFLPCLFAPIAYKTKLVELAEALPNMQIKREFIRCFKDAMGDKCDRDAIIDELLIGWPRPRMFERDAQWYS
jgi:hypothetical protein